MFDATQKGMLNEMMDQIEDFEKVLGLNKTERGKEVAIVSIAIKAISNRHSAWKNQRGG